MLGVQLLGVRDRHDVAGRGDLDVPQNPDGAPLVSWPPGARLPQPQTVKPITSEQVDQMGVKLTARVRANPIPLVG